MLKPKFEAKQPNQLKKWAQKIKNAPQQIEDFFGDNVLSNIQQEIKKEADYPGPVVYADNGKLRWESERQRKFVLGYVLDRDSQGNIIPYQRTGTYYDTVEAIIDVKTITILNTNPISKYVTGRRQQSFHMDTGWEMDSIRYGRIVARQIPLLRDEWVFLIGLPT